MVVEVEETVVVGSSVALSTLAGTVIVLTSGVGVTVTFASVSPSAVGVTVTISSSGVGVTVTVFCSAAAWV